MAVTLWNITTENNEDQWYWSVLVYSESPFLSKYLDVGRTQYSFFANGSKILCVAMGCKHSKMERTNIHSITQQIASQEIISCIPMALGKAICSQVGNVNENRAMR